MLNKYGYKGYWIAFDGVSLWDFGNDSARNAIIFAVDNSSSSNADKRKNNFLTSCEEPTLQNGSPKKQKTKRKTKFWFQWYWRNLLKGNIYDFPADYNAVNKSNILNIHKYLMVKNNIQDAQNFLKNVYWIVKFQWIFNN